MKPYRSGKSLSESVVVLEGLALFRERTRALEAIGGSGSGSGSDSDSGSRSGISTSMTDSGEDPLGEALAGLVSGWELRAVAEAVGIAMAMAIAVAVAVVVGSICACFGIVALTWNLDGLQV